MYLDTASFQNSQSPTESRCSSQFNENEIVLLISALQNKIKTNKQESTQQQTSQQSSTTALLPTINPNIELNSQIRVFNGYFQANTIKSQLPNYEKTQHLTRIDQARRLDDLIFSKAAPQKQYHELDRFEEKSIDIIARSSQSSISDIMVESERKENLDSQTQTSYHHPQLQINQQDLFQLVQDNTQIKHEMRDLNRKLDQLLEQRQNDRQVIQLLLDKMNCMDQLVQRKAEDFQELQLQHSQFLMQLPMLLNQQNHEQHQPSRSTLETTKEFINSFIDSSESQPSTRRKDKDSVQSREKDSVQCKEKENRPPSVKKKILNEEKQLFEEFRNMCFKKKL